MPLASFTLTATALPDIMKFELAQSFIFLLHQSATTATSSGIACLVAVVNQSLDHQ